MINLEIEEIGREQDYFIRSCKVKINGDTIVTPTRTIGVSLSNANDLQASKQFISGKFKPFGEVHARISLSDLNDFIMDDSKGEKFSSRLSLRVKQLKQAGALPYILLTVLDDSGNPLNRLLPARVQKFIFDVLWGIPGNSIIATPLLGVLEKSEYSKLIEAFHERQIASIDRKTQPIMAVIPSSYSLIDPKLIEKYWNYGIRIFGYNCENKKYGAYTYPIESLHNTLTQMSRESEEEYIINAINSKYKSGKGKTSRINNLIGAGFGFDTYSPNHIPPRFIIPSNAANAPKRYIFNNENYGFVDIKELGDTRQVDEIINTDAFRNQDLSELQEMTDYKLKKICNAHDLEKTIKEIEDYSTYIGKNELLDYLSSKERIKDEKAEIEDIRRQKPASTDEMWFK